MPDKKYTKLARNLLVAGSTVGALGWGAWQASRARFLPKTKGVLKLAGLQAPVEVLRDSWGVPHLYAQNTADLFFAQGFVQAQDRFWQMELQRRTAAGRLAEIFGETALPADKFLRKLELYRTAEKNYLYITENENPLLLERFAAGVNAFLAQQRYPFEIMLLRYQPEPWQPVHTLSWLNVMALGQSNNFWTELGRAELVRTVGPELAAKLEPGQQAGHPLIVPHGVDYTGTDFEKILTEYSKLADLLAAVRAPGASNNWVVDGTKSVTGRPLLANDPHIGAQMPGVFYAMQLSAPDFEVGGATVPGVPGVILGRNRHISWGVTNTMADTQDAFIEKADPHNPRRYEYKGEWLDFETHWEEIRVKGQSTVRQEQFRSVHGPIISEFALDKSGAADAGSSQNSPVALAWSLYEKPLSFEGIIETNQAQNWPEFRAAMKKCGFPSLNFVYADTAGNIGYQYTGVVPLRKKGDGLLPNPGHTGEYDWDGFIEFENLPHLFNPPTHFIATANNRVVNQDYPYLLSNEYLSSARASRIRQLLTAQEKFSSEDFRRMMNDRVTLNGLRFARVVAGLGLEAKDAYETKALALLTAWNGNLTAESVAGALYHVVLNKFLRIIFEPQVGEKATDFLLGVGNGGTSQVTAMVGLSGPHVMSFIERGDTSILPAGLTYQAAMQQALTYGVSWLRGKFGNDLKDWQWGKLHQITWSHVMGAKPPLDLLFNRGPLSFGGDADTLFQGSYAPRQDIFVANAGTPAWRLIADMSQLDHDQIAVTGGQSGSPFSPHYTDLLDGWFSAETHPLPFTRAAVTQASVATLRLEP